MAGTADYLCPHVLEFYYHALSPIGLPQEPQWLEFRDLWTAGFVTHYLVMLAGYLMALWIWRRRPRSEKEIPARHIVLGALVAVGITLVLDRVVTWGLLNPGFPGVTYFVQHFLIGFIFLVVWATQVGLDTVGWATGSVMLGLVWTTYGMYLGPTGLPSAVVYLNYRELWLQLLPGTIIASVLGVAAGFWMTGLLGSRPVRR